MAHRVSASEPGNCAPCSSRLVALQEAIREEGAPRSYRLPAVRAEPTTLSINVSSVNVSAISSSIAKLRLDGVHAMTPEMLVAGITGAGREHVEVHG